MKTQKLFERLKEISFSLKETGKARALLALGSVGKETDRADEYSDLDFFAIVKPGYKSEFIQNLDWLSKCCPLEYYFYNTVDGCKALFADGIFCEFAVFEESEMLTAIFTEGRLIWKEDDVPDDIKVPKRKPEPKADRSEEWLIGEAITNIYVGMCRYKRGEILSASRFIQIYAVDRILELADKLEQPRPVEADPFSLERRFEKRFPEIAGYLPLFVQGYSNCPQSALAILEFLNRNFKINSAMKRIITELCAEEQL